MKSENKNLLEDKYLEAQTSLEEEKEFFEKAGKEESFKPWAAYRKSNQFKAPSGLSERIAEKIDSNQTRARNIYFRISAIAASIILIALFYFRPSVEPEMSYTEKQAMLEEILTILPENEISRSDILYEDATLVIYLDNKK